MIVIAATNKPEMVDEAVLKWVEPNILEIPLPKNDQDKLQYSHDVNFGRSPDKGRLNLHPLKFEIIKAKSIEWPRIESPEEIMTVASGRPLEDAARLAFRELIQWLIEDYGFSTYDAYMLLSLTAKARIAQIVDPLCTVVARFS